MKAFLGRSAVIAGALLFGLILFSAKPSIAETLFSPFQQKSILQQDPQKDPVAPREILRKAEAEDAKSSPTTSSSSDSSTISGRVEESETPLFPATNYVATAYSLRGKTASGRMVSKGIIAADPRVLPLGSRVRLEVPGYHGEYLVADTGGLIRGRRIDIWIPSSREAMRFGRRTVKLTVLSYPAKRAKRAAKA
ncbi:MAG: 3D domain-containing protein [Pyrinomonadaceae bacterium]|nr:3D domain-containing protein [Pyrinomonadaceae bacterium]